MKAIGRFLAILLILSMALISCTVFTDNNQASIEGDRYLYRIYDPSTGKYGYIDNQGNIAIKPQFDSGQLIFNDLGLVEVDEKYHYIDRSGKAMFHTSYSHPFFWAPFILIGEPD
jgi:CHAT domain-containing protein